MKFLMAFLRKASIESSNDSSREITKSRKNISAWFANIKIKGAVYWIAQLAIP